MASCPNGTDGDMTLRPEIYSINSSSRMNNPFDSIDPIKQLKTKKKRSKYEEIKRDVIVEQFIEIITDFKQDKFLDNSIKKLFIMILFFRYFPLLIIKMIRKIFK